MKFLIFLMITCSITLFSCTEKSTKPTTRQMMQKIDQHMRMQQEHRDKLAKIYDNARRSRLLGDTVSAAKEDKRAKEYILETEEWENEWEKSYKAFEAGN